MPWTQVYNPTNIELFSTALAAAPIVVLLGTLGLLGWSAPRAAAAGLVTALAVAIGVYGMPWQSALAAAGYGACFGLFPIGWIVLAAVFLYVLTVEAGEFEKVKASVVALSPDRRMQALLIAFSFGAFIEGAAGFGTPVAISAALLIGAGFPPLYAAGLALIANTAPVAFGALGTPIITLAKVTGLLGDATFRDGRPATAAVLADHSGLDGVHDVRLARAARRVAGRARLRRHLRRRAVPDLELSRPVAGRRAGGVGSMVALAALLRFWQPRDVWHFPEENDDEDGRYRPSVDASASYSRREIAHAWVPWVILSACVFLWGCRNSARCSTVATPAPQPSAAADVSSAVVGAAEPPRWHQRAQLGQSRICTNWCGPTRPSSAATIKPKPADLRFNWLSADGHRHLRRRDSLGVLAGHPPGPLRPALPPHAPPPALARCSRSPPCWPSRITTQYSGTRRHARAWRSRGPACSIRSSPRCSAGSAWPSPAATPRATPCSATCNAITAEQLGLNPILICAANSTGGVMGKMIDAQSIVVASRRHRPARQRRANPALRLLAQHRAGQPRRPPHARSGVSGCRQ